MKWMLFRDIVGHNVALNLANVAKIRADWRREAGGCRAVVTFFDALGDVLYEWALGLHDTSGEALKEANLYCERFYAEVLLDDSRLRALEREVLNYGD